MLRQSPPSDQGGHLPPFVEPFEGHLAYAGAHIKGPGQIANHTNNRLVADRPCRGGSCRLLPEPVGALGDPQALLTQDPTDRLDRWPLGALLVDEGDYQRLRGSRSLTKKDVAVAFRICTSSRSQRFSARSRRIWSFSSVVTPEV